MAAELLLSLAVLLLGAKVSAYVFTRIGLSSLLGEIFAGILFGPILLLVAPNGTLGEIAQMGALFLLFLIGLGTKFEDFRENLYVSTVIAIAGGVLSLIAGFLIGWSVFGDAGTGLLIGVSLMATSTAISLKSLMDSGRLETNGGKMFVSVAIADDVIALLALSMLGTYISVGQVDIWKAAGLFFGILGFFFILLTAGSRAVGHVLHVSQRVKDEQILVSVAIAVFFVVAFISEQVGIAGVTGAFLAGMAINKSPLAEKYILPKAKVIGYGFFVPLFMTYSALSFDLGALTSSLGIVILLAIAIATAKVLGCGITGGLLGVRSGENRLIAAGMVPRGEYSIIISNILLTAGLLGKPAYTVILSAVVVTILLAPFIMRLLAPRK